MPAEDSTSEAVESDQSQPFAPASVSLLHSSPLGIEVDHATLVYPVGKFQKSLKNTLLSIFAGDRLREPSARYVVGLKDINLDIQHGERVALIGRNGSGKSTLLRALAGIYPLESGHIRVAGRIGTLLNISLGFEPDATGRENIYYRGLALGFSRKQMREVEDEIVEFAGIGEFIDLPVRTYSAGMFVRLGFAISTQFSPEILLVDEVIGAGDPAFAQLALQRMMRTVEQSGIFVLATHNSKMVRDVCNRVLWLHGGQVRMDGPPSTVMAEYDKWIASISR